VKVIDENFSTSVPAAELQINCDAAQRSSRLELTLPQGGQVGTAFFRDAIPLDNFIADFDLRFDDPSAPGADGMAFILDTGSASTLTECGAAGGGIGYLTGDSGPPAFPGYGIVFDTWQNAGEPSHNWCGFLQSGSATAARAVDVPEEFNGNGTFHARVIGEGGLFRVFLSNSGIGMAEREIFNYRVPGFAAGQTAFVGFSAGTGGAVARHSVDNVCVQVAANVPDAPAAGFSGDVTRGTAPLLVRFTSSSTGEIDSYAWEFGDGGRSTLRNPTHSYAAAGSYSVSLTVSGPGGDDTLVRSGYITVSGAAISADFTATPTIGVAPLAVRFTNTSSGATSYEWDFGDGFVSPATSPTHTFTAGGVYTVSLTARGAGGVENTLVRKNYLRIDGNLVADFQALPTSGNRPLLVNFFQLISGGTFDSVLWDFGDGATSTELDPFHFYQADGVYTVRLQAFGFASVATEEKRGLIRVGQAPAAVFIRSDANDDGTTDLSDGVAILNELFLGVPARNACKDALDANDDGANDLSDGVYVLNYLFQGGPAPPSPFPAPGADPTPDALPGC